MPAESTVRIPGALLERADRIDPDNRSDAIRRACEIGLEELEKQQALKSAGDVEILVSKAVSKSEEVRRLISEEVRKSAPDLKKETRGRVPFLPTGTDDPDGRSPILEVKAGETIEVIVPETPWMVYLPVDLSLQALDPDAQIRVSSLRSDRGSGRDLLMPGWHRPHEFGGAATALAKQEVVISRDLRMLLSSNIDTSVVASLVLQVVRDDAFGPGGEIFRRIEEKSNLILRRKRIRLPLRSRTDKDACSYGTDPANWGVLKVLGIVFEGTPEQLFRTVFRELRVGGGPSLGMGGGWHAAAAFTDLDAGLRAHPVLTPNNEATVEIRSKNGGTPAEPHLVCEVLQDLQYVGD